MTPDEIQEAREIAATVMFNNGRRSDEWDAADLLREALDALEASRAECERLRGIISHIREISANSSGYHANRRLIEIHRIAKEATS